MVGCRPFYVSVGRPCLPSLTHWVQSSSLLPAPSSPERAKPLVYDPWGQAPQSPVTRTVCQGCSQGPASCSHCSRPLPKPGPTPWPLQSPGSLLACSLARPTSSGLEEPADLTDLMFLGDTLDPNQVRACLCAQGPRVTAHGIWLAPWGTGWVCSAHHCVCGP